MAKAYLLLILTLLLTSCVSPSPIDLAAAKAFPEGEAIVFGRVKVIRKGKPSHWTGRSFRIHILPDTGAKPVSYGLKGDGSFYWHLSPGGYTITGFQWWQPLRAFGPVVGRHIFTWFMIPEETSLVYVGTLVISFEEGRYIMRIEDEYAQALQGLKGKFPELKGQAAKRLMNLEKAR